MPEVSLRLGKSWRCLDVSLVQQLGRLYMLNAVQVDTRLVLDAGGKEELEIWGILNIELVQEFGRPSSVNGLF